MPCEWGKLLKKTPLSRLKKIPLANSIITGEPLNFQCYGLTTVHININMPFQGAKIMTSQYLTSICKWSTTQFSILNSNYVHSNINIASMSYVCE